MNRRSRACGAALLAVLIGLADTGSTAPAVGATNDRATNPSTRVEWLACKQDADCTSVELGCYYWQPVNTEFATAMKDAYPPVCLKSAPAGPQPPSGCTRGLCVNKPYTVRFLKQDSYVLYPYLAHRMDACLKDVPGSMSIEDRGIWTTHLLEGVNQWLRDHRVKDDMPLDSLLETTAPCGPMSLWQRGQYRWSEAQPSSPGTARIRIETVQGDYPLDDLYPPLIGYGKTFFRCGQETTRAGATFWGDMHAKFSITSEGTVDPATLEATYPATAYMNRFIGCASTAFKEISFSRPKGGPVEVRAWVQVPFFQ